MRNHVPGTVEQGRAREEARTPYSWSQSEQPNDTIVNARDGLYAVCMRMSTGARSPENACLGLMMHACASTTRLFHTHGEGSGQLCIHTYM